MEEYFRVRAYISEKALRHNARIVKEKIGPGVTWMAVVKADAYGHGIDHVVPILEQEGAGAYAVATLEEAVQVRVPGTILAVCPEDNVTVTGDREASVAEPELSYIIYK